MWLVWVVDRVLKKRRQRKKREKKKKKNGVSVGAGSVMNFTCGTLLDPYQIGCAHRAIGYLDPSPAANGYLCPLRLHRSAPLREIKHHW